MRPGDSLGGLPALPELGARRESGKWSLQCWSPSPLPQRLGSWASPCCLQAEFLVLSARIWVHGQEDGTAAWELRVQDGGLSPGQSTRPRTEHTIPDRAHGPTQSTRPGQSTWPHTEHTVPDRAHSPTWRTRSHKEHMAPHGAHGPGQSSRPRVEYMARTEHMAPRGARGPGQSTQPHAEHTPRTEHTAPRGAHGPGTEHTAPDRAHGPRQNTWPRIEHTAPYESPSCQPPSGRDT